MPKPRAEPRPSPRRRKISRRLKRLHVGRSGVPGADHFITGSAVPVAGAGARTADRASIEAPANVIFHRIGGRLSWRPLSFQPSVRCRLLALSGHSDRTRECPLLE
jgi:hypothetical protein